MKTLFLAAMALAGASMGVQATTITQPPAASTATSVQAGMDLARSKGCMACHAVDRRLVGPSFREIAGRYRNDSTAEARMAEVILKGGRGAWGPIPMPASRNVSQEEAVQLSRWVLAHQ